MNLEFSVRHTIQSRYGSIELNVPDMSTGRNFMIQSDGYKMIPSLRVTQDNISQSDGSVLHPRWLSGVTAIMTLALRVMDEPGDPTCPYSKPACKSDLREMEEELLLHLNGLRQLTTLSQRLFWYPDGYGDHRMLDDIQLLAIWDPSYDLDGEEALISFALESPFPYAEDATEIDSVIGSGSTGGTVTVNNLGNAEFRPVFKVHGPTSFFTLSNLDNLDSDGNPLEIVYDSSRGGASVINTGHYLEIDTFRGTAFLDGSGNNLIAGIDPTVTDFWTILPGSNTIQLVGASADMLWNYAWA